MDYMKEYFNQYKRPGEVYQSPGYAFKNREKLYHLAIFVKNGMANGYALYTDFPVTEEEKQAALKEISSLVVSFRRIHHEFQRKDRIKIHYFEDAQKAVLQWAKTDEERKLANRYHEYMQVILNARQRFLDEYKRMADLQKQLFEKGYFDIADKEIADSIMVNADAALFVLMKRLKDDFEENKVLLSQVEQKRNGLWFYKYRVLVKNLSTSIMDIMADHLEETIDGFNIIWKESEWSDIPPTLESMNHPGLRKRLATSLIERDNNLLKQVMGKVRN